MDHRPYSRHSAILAALAGLLLLSACSGSRRFSGRVVNEQGQPVQNASVEVNGARTSTSATGEFEVRPRAQDRLVLNITHPDYAELVVCVARSADQSHVAAGSRADLHRRSHGHHYRHRYAAGTGHQGADGRDADAAAQFARGRCAGGRRRGPSARRSPRSTSPTAKALPTGRCALTTGARKAISSRMARCTCSSPIRAAG